MAKIKSVNAFEILDTRAIPTVEVTIELSDGVSAKSSVSSGSIKTAYESVEIRDNDKKRYNGMGVLKNIEMVKNIIAPKIIGMDAYDQKKLDLALIELDGTPNKSKLGTNTSLPVSQSLAKAAAKSLEVPLHKYISTLLLSENINKKLPTPLFNIIEGGKHVLANPGFQEYLILPATSKKMSECLEIGVEIYNMLKNVLYEKGLSTLVAGESGFAPNSTSNQECLNILKQSIEQTIYRLSFDVFLGIDAAANSFKINNIYKLAERSAPYDNKELVSYYENLASEFSLIYIEDPLSDSDIEGWKNINQSLSSKSLIVSDDLTSSNPYRLQMAIDQNLINGIVIKPTQIGTVMETIAICEMARFKKLKIIISGRSGETSDDFISDFAVGVFADYVKFGAPAHERIFKYNRLLEIEAEPPGNLF